MATDAVRADLATAATPGDLPYARSWIDALIGRIGRAPGSTWMVYAVLIVLGVTGTHIQGWLAGTVAVGQLSLVPFIWGALVFGVVAMVDVFSRIAGSSFDTVRPLTQLSDSEASRLRYELTVIPARTAIVAIGLSILVSLGYYLGDPVASGVAGLHPLTFAMRATAETFLSTVLIAFIAQTVRQLRLVSRILDHVTRIDLFHPRPLYAFSRLTSGIAVTLIGFLAAALAGAPSGQAQSLLYLAWYVGIIAFSIVVFIVPLLGLHNRFRDVKEQLQVEADERLKGILVELNTDAARLDLGRADGLNKTLSSLLQQRDVLAKLPTWPWSTGTFRGFVTAICLPIGLFLAQRVLSQFVR